MGTGYDYACKACGYEVEVDGLGGQRGLGVTLESCTCPVCRAIVDVVLQSRTEADPPVVLWVHGKWLTEKDLGRRIIVCDECDCSELVPWEPPYPCPKCAEPMVQKVLPGDWVTLRMWD